MAAPPLDPFRITPPVNLRAVGVSLKLVLETPSVPGTLKISGGNGNSIPIKLLDETAAVDVAMGWLKAFWEAAEQRGKHPFRVSEVAHCEVPAADALGNIERLLENSPATGSVITQIRAIIAAVPKERR